MQSSKEQQGEIKFSSVIDTKKKRKTIEWERLQTSSIKLKVPRAKMGTIKDRKDLTESEETKKRWQEYTEELYGKYLNDLENYRGVDTHLEPDILECKGKWALGSITTNKDSRGDGIPAELFQILKNDAVRVLHSICQQIWKTQQWPQDWKRSVFIPIPKEGQCQKMFKLLHNCTYFIC